MQWDIPHVWDKENYLKGQLVRQYQSHASVSKHASVSCSSCTIVQSKNVSFDTQLHLLAFSQPFYQVVESCQHQNKSLFVL